MMPKRGAYAFQEPLLPLVFVPPPFIDRADCRCYSEALRLCFSDPSSLIFSKGGSRRRRRNEEDATLARFYLLLGASIFFWGETKKGRLVGEEIKGKIVGEGKDFLGFGCVVEVVASLFLYWGLFGVVGSALIARLSAPAVWELSRCRVSDRHPGSMGWGWGGGGVKKEIGDLREMEKKKRTFLRSCRSHFRKPRGCGVSVLRRKMLRGRKRWIMC